MVDEVETIEEAVVNTDKVEEVAVGVAEASDLDISLYLLKTESITFTWQFNKCNTACPHCFLLSYIRIHRV